MKNKKKLDAAIPSETPDPKRITAEDLLQKNSPNKPKPDSKGCCNLL